MHVQENAGICRKKKQRKKKKHRKANSKMLNEQQTERRTKQSVKFRVIWKLIQLKLSQKTQISWNKNRKWNQKCNISHIFI